MSLIHKVGCPNMGRISAKKDMVVRSFRKRGISVAMDGSEDCEINIKALKDYVVEGSDSDDENTEEEDPFFDRTDDDNNLFVLLSNTSD